MSPFETSDRAAALREAFDETFVAASATRQAETENFLAVRVGSAPYAIHLSHIDGIVAGRPIVPVPSNNPNCLGVAGIRGMPVPVFGLAAIVGAQREPNPRWFVLSGREEPIAFAFAALDGYLRLPREEKATTAHARGAEGAGLEVIRTGTGVRPVLNIPHFVSVLCSRTRQNGQEQ